MLKVILIFLPSFILNLYRINLEPTDDLECEATYFFIPNEKEYIIIYPDTRFKLFSYYDSPGTNLIRLDSKTDEIIAHERLYNKGIIFLNLIQLFIAMEKEIYLILAIIRIHFGQGF